MIHRFYWHKGQGWPKSARNTKNRNNCFAALVPMDKVYTRHKTHLEMILSCYHYQIVSHRFLQVRCPLPPEQWHFSHVEKSACRVLHKVWWPVKCDNIKICPICTHQPDFGIL